MSQLLNYKRQGHGPTLVLIHGLFGSLDNLGVLARELATQFDVISVDMRNHGQSFHSDSHSYDDMAEDLARLFEELSITKAMVIGHSMGGKAAMRLAGLHPELVHSLVIMDMAPVNYQTRRHDNVIAGLEAVQSASCRSRAEANEVMAQHIEMPGVRQFLGKSLYNRDGLMNWRFNVASLVANYSDIIGWQPQPAFIAPTLFIKGGESDYITADHQAHIKNQFPNASAHIIANTGHWLHAEKPNDVLRIIRKFIEKNPL